MPIEHTFYLCPDRRHQYITKGCNWSNSWKVPVSTDAYKQLLKNPRCSTYKNTLCLQHDDHYGDVTTCTVFLRIYILCSTPYDGQKNNICFLGAVVQMNRVCAVCTMRSKIFLFLLFFNVHRSDYTGTVMAERRW